MGIFESKMVSSGYKNQENPRPGYYKTPCDVYYRGNKIDKADASKFKKLSHGWAKDNKNVYYKGKIVIGIDSNTFRLKNNVGQDKNGKWYKGELCN